MLKVRNSLEQKTMRSDVAVLKANTARRTNGLLPKILRRFNMVNLGFRVKLKSQHPFHSKESNPIRAHTEIRPPLKKSRAGLSTCAAELTSIRQLRNAGNFLRTSKSSQLEPTDNDWADLLSPRLFLELRGSCRYDLHLRIDP